VNWIECQEKLPPWACWTQIIWHLSVGEIDEILGFAESSESSDWRHNTEKSPRVPLAQINRKLGLRVPVRSGRKVHTRIVRSDLSFHNSCLAERSPVRNSEDLITPPMRRAV